MTVTHDLTPASAELLRALANDACEWGGSPCYGANVGGSAADRGNLTDLKRRGLLRTIREGRTEWVEFTEEGRAMAATMGITI